MHHGFQDLLGDSRKARSQLEGLLVLRDVPTDRIVFREEEGVDLAVRRTANPGCRHEFGIGADGKVPRPLEPRPVCDESLPPGLRHGIPSTPGMKGSGADGRPPRVGEESPLLSRSWKDPEARDKSKPVERVSCGWADAV